MRKTIDVRDAILTANHFFAHSENYQVIEREAIASYLETTVRGAAPASHCPETMPR